MNIKLIIRPFAFLFFIITGLLPVKAELKLDNWKTYTSLLDVRTLAMDFKGRIWAGTTGGVFVYDSNSEDIKEIRNTEGLLSLNISCIRINKQTNEIFICSSNGTIQVLNDKGQWKYVTDILNAKFPDPVITDIEFLNDTAFISGGFGLTKLNLKDLVFIETVSKFGSFTPGIRVNDILIQNGNIWAATKEGVAKTNLSNTITNPVSWEVYTKSSGLNDNNVKFIQSYNDTVFIATEYALCKYGSSSFTVIQHSPELEEISGFVQSNGELLYSTKNDVYKLDNSPLKFGKYRNINGLFVDDVKNNLIALFQYFGISLFSGENENNIMPNSPISNNFINLDVDMQGRLWAATKPKSENDGQGFMMLGPNGVWRNFNSRYNPVISNWAIKVKGVSSGDVYVSTWGGGLLKLSDTNGDFLITCYDTSNSPLVGALENAPDYVICGEVAEDMFGKIWIINYGENSFGPLLMLLKNNGNFISYNNMESLTERQYLELAIDRYGTKWLGSNNIAKGLYYFNDNDSPEDKSDDKYGKLTKSNSSLLDNEITSIDIDKNGFIWLGTNSGLNFIYDSYPAKTGGNVSVRAETQLQNQYINDIYVDAINNKWIATNKGIWVLNEDASGLLSKNILNSSNSPLIADEVFSITSDTKTGTMYFGTKYGLSTARSLSVEPAPKYNVSCYPQPYNPKKDSQLIIDGLMENSDVRILTVDGALVRALTAKGRIASWDGKDELGNFPESGVYIVVGSSETAEGSGTGKFTLINK